MTNSNPAPDFGPLLAQAGASKTYSTGDILFALGEAGSVMYWIEHGSVDLYFTPGKFPKRIGPGDFFGELGFILGDHRRTATAVVSSPETHLRILDQPVLGQLAERAPNAVLGLVRQTVCRLLESEQQLSEELQQRNWELEASLDFGSSMREVMECSHAGNLFDRQTGLFARQSVLAYLEDLDNREALADAGCWIIRVHLDRLEGLRRTLGRSFVQATAGWVAGLLRKIARAEDMPFQIDRFVYGILLPGADESLVADMEATLSTLLNTAPLEVPGHEVRLAAGLDRLPVQRFYDAARALARYGDLPDPGI